MFGTLRACKHCDWQLKGNKSKTKQHRNPKKRCLRSAVWLVWMCGWCHDWSLRAACAQTSAHQLVNQPRLAAKLWLRPKLYHHFNSKLHQIQSTKKFFELRTILKATYLFSKSCCNQLFAGPSRSNYIMHLFFWALLRYPPSPEAPAIFFIQSATAAVTYSH